MKKIIFFADDNAIKYYGDLVYYLKNKKNINNYKYILFTNNYIDDIKNNINDFDEIITINQILKKKLTKEIVDEVSKYEKKCNRNFLKASVADRNLYLDCKKNIYLNYDSQIPSSDIISFNILISSYIIDYFNKNTIHYIVGDFKLTLLGNLAHIVATSENVLSTRSTINRIDNLYSFSNSPYDFFPDIEKDFQDNKFTKVNNENNFKKAEFFLKKYLIRESEQYYDAMRTNNVNKKYSLLEKLKKFLLKILNYNKSLKNSVNKSLFKYQNINHLRIKYFYVKNMIKVFIINNINYTDFKKIENHKYVYYPLQSEPEAALNIESPTNLNQIELIRNISHSLPIDTKLVVRDHPRMKIIRSSGYYKKIAVIPNVYLIKSSVENFKIIKNSKMILAITGTTLLEGANMGIPGIAFGKTFLNKLSFITYIENLSKLSESIKETMEKNVPKDELIKFYAAIYKNSIEFADGGPYLITDKYKLNEKYEFYEKIFSKYYNIIFNNIDNV